MQPQTNHWENMFQTNGEPGWWENGRYVFNPEGLTLQLWYFFSNICFFFAIYGTCGHLAFDLATVGQRDNLIEVFFDSIFLIDILLVFFTAAELPQEVISEKEKRTTKNKQKKTTVFERYEFHMGKIMKHYITSYFFIDILACIPSLVTLYQYRILFYFKLFRFLQLPRVFAWFRQVKSIILNRSHTHYYLLENVTSVVMQATEFLMVFHIMSCIWIRLNINDQDSWIYNKFDSSGRLWEDQQSQYQNFDIESASKIRIVYTEAYYFMSTTMSCIGYGDITPESEMQKVFVIIC